MFLKNPRHPALLCEQDLKQDCVGAKRPPRNFKHPNLSSICPFWKDCSSAFHWCEEAVRVFWSNPSAPDCWTAAAPRTPKEFLGVQGVQTCNRCGRGCWPWWGLVFRLEAVENLGAILLFRIAPIERLCAMPMCHWREASKRKRNVRGLFARVSDIVDTPICRNLWRQCAVSGLAMGGLPTRPRSGGRSEKFLHVHYATCDCCTSICGEFYTTGAGEVRCSLLPNLPTASYLAIDGGGGMKYQCVCHVHPDSCCMLERCVSESCIPKQAALRAQACTERVSHRIGLSNQKCSFQFFVQAENCRQRGTRRALSENQLQARTTIDLFTHRKQSWQISNILSWAHGRP